MTLTIDGFPIPSIPLMKGKEAYNKLLERAGQLDEYLSNIIERSYDDTMLICHPVTSRNPYSSSIYIKLGRGYVPEKRGTNPALPLLKYYVKSIAGLFFYLAHYICFLASRLRVDTGNIDRGEPLVVISTYAMIEKIYPKGSFEDAYFGTLYRFLAKKNRQSVLLCILFGEKPWNFLKRIQTYNILSKDGRNFVTEFELMGWSEWRDLIRFILVYPLKVLGLSKVEFGQFDDLFREESIHALSSTQFQNYVRYLAGRRLKDLTAGKLTVLDWYENQTISKLLFRGLRESGAKTEILGCQFFTKQPLLRNLYPLKAECLTGVAPDRVLVSGKYYLGDFDESFSVSVGVSPRSRYLFDIDPRMNNIDREANVLLLTTYDIHQSQRMVTLVEWLGASMPVCRVTIRLHPNHAWSKPFAYPEYWTYSEERLETLCLKSAIVITSGSDAALEAAVMGCSVIIVGDMDGLTFNPMPEYGRGQIWELVFDEKGLTQAITDLSDFRKRDPGMLKEIALTIRDMFFTDETDERYTVLLDL